MKSKRKKRILKQLLGITLPAAALLYTVLPVRADEGTTLDNRLQRLEEAAAGHKHKHSWKGLTITGQMTAIYQTSDLDLKLGDLVDENGAARPDYTDFAHKNGGGSFSADLFVKKEFNHGSFLFNLEFANGAGVDAPLQGGAMVNNDVMEYFPHHKEPYIARAYYEHILPLSADYKLVFDLGKFGVPDFFDEGERVADQTTQFINQAINNNGAFDYVQGLDGHGYTYGARAALESSWITLSGAVMSSDAHLDNLDDKYSLIGALVFEHGFSEEIEGDYGIYVFKNYGEYARFDGAGNLVSKDSNTINTKDNRDDLDKAGFGLSIDQSLPLGFNLFAKYGRQDDDRDVRHYQDMDESIMFGFDVSGQNWGRREDVLGVAYEIGKLTGNHRKAHEKGYESFFNRPGIGAGNYADERVLEVYYKLALPYNTALSLDYQHVDNFYYSKKIGAVDFWAVRFHWAF